MLDLLLTFSLLGIFVVPFLLIAAASSRRQSYRHIRTKREDDMHDQIQRAMNWSPEHFHLDEDGKYRNAYGKEGVVMTLEELLGRSDKEKNE